MSEHRKIPATVVTGFLGAGKTTLIRHLLETANGKRLALIINEFGDIGVDGEVLKACGSETCGEEDIVELANGCICCTVADDFVPTIETLLARDPQPDHIVIETSGLALPKPLVRAFAWPEIRTRLTVDGVVAVVDGPAVANGLFAEDPEAVQAQREADEALDHDSPLEEVFEDQVNCADLVIINKTDAMSDDSRSETTQDLRTRLRPSVKMIEASHAAVDADILLGLTAAAEDDLDVRPSHHDGHHD
ncbi:MAG: cobalamin biosynthesis protein CobW, partial [Pseudomonadota bacterium]|nr:cobalamin biosynthesis protein CobW [Pseudomonadota bacterium]